MKFVLWFAIAGGVGIPLLFLASWQIISKTLNGTATMVNLMVWVEAFRVMFWPSSMFLVVNTPGDGAGELNYLMLLILANVGVYALMGLAVALAIRSRAAQIVLGLFLLVAMYGLNAYWSEHLASFTIAGILVMLLLVGIFRKFGASSPQPAN
jgi:hypothetical protein